MSQVIKANENFPSLRNLLSDFFDAEKFLAPAFLDSITKDIPRVNIREAGNKFELEFAAPGFKKNDFKIEVENGVLKVSAEKKEEKTEEKKNFMKKEFSYNGFSRSFTLPDSANENEINAGYNDGILTLEILKKAGAEKKSRKEINVA